MLQRIKNRFRYYFFTLGLRSRFLASFYYCFFSNSFHREHYSVINGKALFKTKKEIVKNSSTVLRRNTHRLEKGLIMKPRRPLFALAYIQETVIAYCDAVQRCELSKQINELYWAKDVLTAYFEACENHPTVDKCRKLFLECKQLPKTKTNPDRHDKFKPYKRSDNKPVTLEFNDLLALAKQRRSVRWFKQCDVPRDLIEKALKIAALSPSACNRQPFEFRFFDDPSIKSKIGELPSGTVGFSDNFPVTGVLLGNLAHYYDEKDRHVIYIDGAMASMSFILALETLGLSSCCINWPDIEEYELKAEKLLGLKPNERPIMFLAIGYADPEGMIPYSEKKTINQLCRWNYIPK